MKSKDLQQRLLYPATLPLRTEGQVKSFLDKTTLKKFINITLKKGLLEEEEGRGGGGGEGREENMNKMAINTYLSTTESKK